MILSERQATDPPANSLPGIGATNGITSARRARRTAGVVKLISIVVIVIALFVIIRALPVDRAIDLVKVKADGLGVWGPLALGVVYVVAALAFVPGSALTLAAGAVFGLVWGTITVSVASTIAATLAFLIARYLARDKVAQQARKYPKFEAIDDAIGAEGWKIIAMLRLVPFMPYSLGNYLYGLTAIRFWPYVLASWLFMLPGTFMYVYLAHVGTEGLRSAAGAEQGRTPGEWALLGVGLLALIAVTGFVTRLARKALRERTRIDEPAIEVEQPGEPAMHNAAVATGWPWGTTLLAILAVALLTAAAYTHQQRDTLKNVFGPPPVMLQEAYQRQSDGPTFDHSAFDALLRKHVDKDGWVDYEGLGSEAASLDTYIASVGNAPFDDLDRDEKLALLINAYNAFTLRLILDHYPIKSIKDIPAARRWDAKRWRVGSMTLSLNQIEHQQIRPKFAEPRIHFALVCAAIGCPKLRNEAFQAERIEEQLEDQTRYVHSHDRWFRYQLGARKVHLTKLYDWYGSDFRQVADSELAFAARYSAPLKAALGEGKQPKTKWLDYDWTLNDAKNKR
ncbi:MAG: VTT domain-containing protein [Planctomycetes bacterium]|nr:VTT domain-containing protein [Planctomycetota bacterium]